MLSENNEKIVIFADFLYDLGTTLRGHYLVAFCRRLSHFLFCGIGIWADGTMEYRKDLCRSGVGFQQYKNYTLGDHGSLMIYNGDLVRIPFPLCL